MDESVIIKNEAFKSIIHILKYFSHSKYFTDLELCSILNREDIFSIHFILFTCFSTYFNEVSEINYYSKFKIQVEESSESIYKFCYLIYDGECKIDKDSIADFEDLLMELMIVDYQMMTNPLNGDLRFILLDYEERLEQHLYNLQDAKYFDTSFISTGLSVLNFHSVIIAAQCNLLFKIFQKRKYPKKSIAIYTRFSLYSIKKIKEYCYTGKMLIKLNSLKEMYDISIFLKINPLSEKLLKILSRFNYKNRIVPSDMDVIKFEEPPVKLSQTVSNILKENENDFCYMYSEGTCFIVHTRLLCSLSPRIRSIFSKHIWFKTDLILTIKFPNRGIKDLIKYMYSGDSIKAVELRILRWFQMAKKEFTQIPRTIKKRKQTDSTEHYFIGPITSSERVILSDEDITLHNKNDFDENLYCFNQTKTNCEKCGYVFANKEQVVKHQIIHQKQPCVCTTCGLVFNSLWILQKHLSRHRSPRQFICIYCGAQFLGKVSFQFHLKFHIKNKIKYEEKCEEKFDKSKRDEHLKKHMVGSMCNICKRTYLTKSKLKEHLKYVHREHPKYYCEFCIYVANNKRELTAHIFQIHGFRKGAFKTIKEFSCTQCFKMFGSNKILKEHLLSHKYSGAINELNQNNLLDDTKHQINQAINCLICQQEFSSDKFFDHQEKCFKNLDTFSSNMI